MWKRGWRDDAWDRLGEPWDLIVIGGGVTGAGILAEAAKLGLRAVLLEGGDFASGTSSRSSKLVHGGMRYLKQAQPGLTLESIRERDQLLRELPGLVERIPFLLTHFHGDKTPAWVFTVGVILYDLFALQWDHEKVKAAQLVERAPALKGAAVRHAYRMHDGQTDDARLVLRVLQEAERRGAVALSHAKAEQLLRERAGRVVGVVVRDMASDGRTAEVRAPVVINATGAWADDLRERIGAPRRLRLIRGSHLAFPLRRLPLPAAIMMFHRRDNRAVFAVPWDGVAIVGTTDVDHGLSMATEPTISAAEAEYLLELCRFAFPSLELTADDVRSTWAGVRPVVDTGAVNPSKESREHAIWKEDGLLTVTGGKLTTFRAMAREALRAVRRELPGRKAPRRGPLIEAVTQTGEALGGVDPAHRLRLLGRYGTAATAVVECGDINERIDDSTALWNELRWAARAEGVVHLDDLLLRRVRLGLLLERGGFDLMDRIRAVAQPELGWDDARWEAEERAYRKITISASAK